MFLLLATFAACKKEKDDHDNDHDHNEEELITTLQLHFHSLTGSEHKHFTFRDLDGNGGNPPVIDADTLTAGLVYEVSVEVLNESVSPTDSITAEILAEGVDHQFFFQPSGAGVTISYTDADSNGNPIGLGTEWAAGVAGSGSIMVTLRHQPNKAAPGVSSGQIANAGGETDIEVTFPLVIE